MNRQNTTNEPFCNMAVPLSSKVLFSPVFGYVDRSPRAVISYCALLLLGDAVADCFVLWKALNFFGLSALLAVPAPCWRESLLSMRVAF